MNKKGIILLASFIIGLGVISTSVKTQDIPITQVPVITNQVPAPTSGAITSKPVITNGSSSGSSLSPLKHLSLRSNNVVLVVDEIDESAVKIADEIKAKERAGANELYVLINSPGGSVLDGALIVSAIEAANIPVYTVCLQLCASMSAIIHAYGTERYAVARSNIMYHPAAAGVQGTVPQMLSRLNWINSIVYKMDSYIARRAGLEPDTFVQMLNNELWLDAEDATAAHFNDQVVSVDLQLSKPVLELLERTSVKMRDRLAISLE